MGKILRRAFIAITFVGVFGSIFAVIDFPAADTITALENDELAVFQVQNDPPPGFTMPWVDGSTLVYFPSGEFIMGADEEDNPDQDNPAHTVSLGSFWIYQTEVTNLMYAKCVEEECDPPIVDPAIPDYTLPEQANKPVVGVSWEMAKTYCQWAQGQLPSEAQWEFAARGLNGNTFPWGEDEPTCDLLNFNDCVGETTAVDAYPDGSSPYGVLGMAGNVSEWVADWYQEDYYAEALPENPTGPENGQARSIRGSSYQSGSEQVPSSQRFYLEPDEYRTDLGFRCVVAHKPGSNTPKSGPVGCGCLPGCSPGCLPLTSCKTESDPPATAPPATELPATELPESDPPESGNAPICETSFEVDTPKVESVDCPTPMIDVGESYCQREVGYVNVEVQACNQMTQLTGDGASFQEYETNKIVSYGSSGASAQLEVCCGCPDIQPPEWKCDDVQCPENYELDFSDCSCVFQAPPNVQKAEPGVCTPGFAFDPLGLCCVPEKISIPCQGVYDPSSHICQLPLPQLEPKCVTEKINLPTCTRSGGGDGACVDPVGCTTSSRCGQSGAPPCCCP